VTNRTAGPSLLRCEGKSIGNDEHTS
jgi:hypothetical protein